MREHFGPKTWLYPMPVLMIGTWGADGTPCLMNAAWGGISEENKISICISENHKTTENILQKHAFTVSPAVAAHVSECDYFGIVSGNDVPDKVARAGFHAESAKTVDAPVFRELPMALECELISYDPVTCRLVGRIVNISAESCILGSDGKIDPKKLDPIVYDSVTHRYYTLGTPVGQAFSAGEIYK